VLKPIRTVGPVAAAAQAMRNREDASLHAEAGSAELPPQGAETAVEARHQADDTAAQHDGLFAPRAARDAGASAEPDAVEFEPHPPQALAAGIETEPGRTPSQAEVEAAEHTTPAPSDPSRRSLQELYLAWADPKLWMPLEKLLPSMGAVDWEVRHPSSPAASARAVKCPRIPVCLAGRPLAVVRSAQQRRISTATRCRLIA